MTDLPPTEDASRFSCEYAYRITTGTGQECWETALCTTPGETRAYAVSIMESRPDVDEIRIYGRAENSTLRRVVRLEFC